MQVSALKCLKCETVIWSKSRHDFRECTCGACFIDGGREYTRCGAEDLSKVAYGIFNTDTDTFSAITITEE